MPDVIFARPRHHYDSYTDLYALITASGFPLIFADDIDPDSDHCYIVTLLNGETQGGWPGARARIILWDLEWRVNDPPCVPGVAEVWASDPWYAVQIGARYVPLGSHPSAGVFGHPVEHPTPVQDKDGVAALMYTGPYRRNHMIGRLRASGVTVHDPAWGRERMAVLDRAAAMLHLHQHDDVPTVAPLRWAIAANQCLPVISEAVAAPVDIPGTLWSDYDGLVGATLLALGDPDRLRDCGMALHGHLCHDHPFDVCVGRAL